MSCSLALPQLFALGTFVSIVMGCSKSGPELADVSGVVTLDGQPLSQAVVMFKPQRGRPSLAETDANGHYKLIYRADDAGARLGPHRVSISTYKQADNYLVKKTIPERVPAKYNSNSTLQAEVKSGSNTMDFNLTTR
jgi:hypothetical protein